MDTAPHRLVFAAILLAIAGLAAGCAGLFKRSLPTAKNPATAEKPLVVETKTTRGDGFHYECDAELPDTRLVVSTGDGGQVCLEHRAYDFIPSGAEDDQRYAYADWKYEVQIDGSAQRSRLDTVQEPKLITTCEQSSTDLYGNSAGERYRVFEHVVAGCVEGAQLTGQSQQLFVFRGTDELGAWNLE